MEHTNCNLCGADDTRIIYRFGSSNVVRCRRCGLVYKDPRRSSADQVRMDDACIKSNVRSRLLRSKKDMFTRHLTRIERLAGKGRLLDIGCGYGDFLRIASEKDWIVSGVDISEKYSCFAKEVLGLNVFNGTVEKAGFPDDHFDVVTMWDSLDYMYDPLKVLSEAKRILKPGGFVFIRLRNAIFHVNLKRVSRDSKAIVHLYSFSPGTIRRMLKRAGFRNIKILNSEVSGTGVPSRCINIITGFLNCIFVKKFLISPSLSVYAGK